jgi:peptide-methionine (S)-S-oxide reductase
MAAIRLIILLAITLIPLGCADRGPDHHENENLRASREGPMADSKGRRQVATFGGGCFWCVEAVLQQIDGVHDLKSGFMGGHVDNPTYDDICTKTTGHIEVVQVKFDPDVLSYEKLLKWFFKSHDPTSMDRQGGDAGPQYRSAIFWHGDEQKQTAETLIKKIDEADVFASKIVTVVREAEKFWIADAEHQDYYRRNKDQRYCQLVIAPKLGKLGLDK